MEFLATIATAFLFLAQDSPECSISGRLTNIVTGAPARKAVVGLNRPGIDSFTRSAISDTSGRYCLIGVPPGSYRLWARRDGLLPMTYGAKGPNRPGKFLVLPPGQKLTDVNFAMQPPAVIAGRVLDEDAEPVPGVSVGALQENFAQAGAQFRPIANTVTNDIGEYRLFGLPTGKFYLMASQSRSGAMANGGVYSSAFYPGASDFAAAAAVNVAIGGEARDIDIHVVKTSTVALRGTVANVPPGGERSLQVEIGRKDRALVDFGNRWLGGFNATTGQFEFQGLTPGSYIASARLLDKGKSLYARQEVEVGSVDLNDVRLTLENCLEIPGAVIVDGEAAEAAAWRVTLSRTEPSSPLLSAVTGAGQSFVLHITPGATWRVNVGPIPPNAYLESIKFGEVDGLMKPLTITPGTKGPLTVVLSMHGGTVTGTVKTAGEKPEGIENAAVLLMPAREYWGVPSYCKAAVTDSQGHYEMKGIAPGTYRLLALEDLEPFAYLNPEFQKRMEGRGVSISFAKDSRAAQDLTLEPLP